MVIVKVMGGLGNQLQQYAIYRKFESLGVEASLDFSWFEQKSQKKQLKPRELELDFFDELPYRTCTKEEREALLGKDTFTGRVLKRLMSRENTYFAEQGRMYLPEIFERKDVYLEGYFACEKYYADILETLRQDIRFPKSSNPKNRELAEQMEKECSVSIHLRRGDYLDAGNAELFGNICTPEYYDKAVRFVRQQVKQKGAERIHFYVFSDDAEYARNWCGGKQYDGERYTVIDWNDGRDSFYDMYLMSRCKHNICANSTFSFWGARLNPHTDKMMIRPLKHRNNQEYDIEEMQRLWEGWTLIL
ncbi:MAG: alpha-1,2-fucosyltransferase [Clostridiales bacterium]|nr:alpha-1,2-fucosyltransferase [Clostridiales bacterium]